VVVPTKHRRGVFGITGTAAVVRQQEGEGMYGYDKRRARSERRRLGKMAQKADRVWTNYGGVEVAIYTGMLPMYLSGGEWVSPCGVVRTDNDTGLCDCPFCGRMQDALQEGYQ